MYYSMKQIEAKILEPDVAKTIAYVIAQGRKDESEYRGRELASAKYMLWALCCGHTTVDDIRAKMVVEPV